MTTGRINQVALLRGSRCNATGFRGAKPRQRPAHEARQTPPVEREATNRPPRGKRTISSSGAKTARQLTKFPSPVYVSNNPRIELCHRTENEDQTDTNCVNRVPGPRKHQRCQAARNAVCPAQSKPEGSTEPGAT